MHADATPPDPALPQSPAPNTPPVSEEELKRALGMFKKRLKLTRLDHESKLGASKPLTGGKRFDDMGITLPRDHPREVWMELRRRGLIKDLGQGFYSLP